MIKWQPLELKPLRMLVSKPSVPLGYLPPGMSNEDLDQEAMACAGLFMPRWRCLPWLGFAQIVSARGVLPLSP